MCLLTYPVLTSPPIISDLGGDVSTGDLSRALLFFDILSDGINNAKL